MAINPNLQSGMKIAALAGGVGAARLLEGLQHWVAPADLTVIVNTGDDFCWMGLHVSPDLDTIMYALAGVANPASGWGIRDDSFRCIQRLEELGEEAWFAVGDLDLATHILRTERLRSGQTLSQVSRELAAAHGVRAAILPMTDSPAPTMMQTVEGTLAFQEYFVRRKCRPQITGIDFRGAGSARPAPGVLEALAGADAILICPSNPFISIGPVLAVQGLRDAIRESRATVLAVTPIIAGRSVKGPAADMMRDLGLEVSALGVARIYADLADTFVLDTQDGHLRDSIEALDMRVRLLDTLMDSRERRLRCARQVLEALA
ncbi:MAG: 2-phospho-L-lactate transferase [Acidobacteriota bacterium]